jgi:branched-chain amino acid transport system substrate-binding protein
LKQKQRKAVQITYRILLSALLSFIWAGIAWSHETIKIGIVGPFTGPFATTGEGFKQGIAAFTALNGNLVGDRKVEVIFRDTAGDPAAAKRLTEELVVKDHVAILGGYMLTPEALAAVSVANEAKTPVLLFSAAAPSLVQLSPYFIRMGENSVRPPQLTAEWARANGKSRGYTAVADYAPGHVVEGAFSERFRALGGTMVGSDRIPLNTVDFAPFAERVARADPDILDIFIPTGAPAVGYIKALADRGLMNKIAVVGLGEAEDKDLHLYDDSVINLNQILHYTPGIDNVENVNLKKKIAELFGSDVLPSIYTAGAYDGMRVAYKMIESISGDKLDGDVAMKSILGYSFRSPRGLVTIDAATRENIHNSYLLRVEKKNGKLVNSIVETFGQVPALQPKKQ